jgi:hypothetical protein
VLIQRDNVTRLKQVEKFAEQKKILGNKNASSKMHGTPIALS